MSTTIFASKERRECLDSHGIKYKVNEELCFVFTAEEYKKARKILRNALLL